MAWSPREVTESWWEGSAAGAGDCWAANANGKRQRAETYRRAMDRMALG
jgi:hypothetical protein